MIPRGTNTRLGLSLTGGAHDVLTRPDGSGVVLDEATIRARLGEERVLESLATDPGAALRGLTGRIVGAGFRAAVDTAVPRLKENQTPLYLLLDDLPVAALIAGYADLYLRAPDEPPTSSQAAARKVKADICAGWASDATMMQAIASEGQIPIPVGPPAPAIELAGDPLSWHAIPELPVGAMRRRRRIDVAHSGHLARIRHQLPAADADALALRGRAPSSRFDVLSSTPASSSGPRDQAGRRLDALTTKVGDGCGLAIDAMFRDTHVGPDGTETVLHEYSLTASADAGSYEILHCRAEARVLPWVECPAAAASAGRLAGRRLPELRTFVRQSLTGTSTCTHLNDLLRSLADAAPLADRLRAHL